MEVLQWKNRDTNKFQTRMKELEKDGDYTLIQARWRNSTATNPQGCNTCKKLEQNTLQLRARRINRIAFHVVGVSVCITIMTYSCAYLLRNLFPIMTEDNTAYLVLF